MLENTTYRTPSIKRGSKKDHKKPKKEYLYRIFTSLKAKVKISERFSQISFIRFGTY